MPTKDFAIEAARSESDQCIVWPHARQKSGYGVTWWNNRWALAHRVVCRLAHGEPPEGTEVCHSCDNPPCVNPRHLRWDTKSANAKDRGNAHLTGEDNGSSKLTRESK